jgi:hypothetical protein
VSKKTEKRGDFDSYIDEAIGNIRSDRALASKLLIDLVQFMQQQSDHATLGSTAAKYLETLQRSNEQLVKITATLGKQNPGSVEISEDEIYDMINGERDDGKER